MAIFTRPRAFENATPAAFGPVWAGSHPSATQAKLAGCWSTGDDGRLVWRWRLTTLIAPS